MDFSDTGRDTNEARGDEAVFRSATASKARVMADPATRARHQDELDVFMSFGAFPLRNLITRLGLLAIAGGAVALVALAALNA